MLHIMYTVFYILKGRRYIIIIMILFYKQDTHAQVHTHTQKQHKRGGHMLLQTNHNSYIIFYVLSMLYGYLLDLDEHVR